ncbi:MAG: UDP-N-acetylmuramoyl-L-alanine--D-glutamate ligase [bacterium]|jgi:UDP-N-acetylmuramoylalanine--D-glutamate ligase
MDLNGKRIGVYGYGVTGRAVVAALIGHPCQIVVFDDRDDAQLASELSALAKEGDVEFHLGGWSPEEQYARLNLLVVSPGINLERPSVALARNFGVEVLSEIELGWRLGKGTVLAVTGSNGKSTTTALLGKIIARSLSGGKGRVHVAGNIGSPYIAAAVLSGENDITVLEVSSYQLEASPTFHPHVAIYTNITPDHLDRHKTFEAYAAVKRSMVRNLTRNDFVIYNSEDENLQPEKFPNSSPVFYGFTSAHGSMPEKGAWLENGEILVDLGRGVVERYPQSMVKLRGLHNVENCMCALLAARVMDVSQADIIDAVSEFEGYPHRIEFVREIGGVKYYNDSKATNPESTITALRAFDEPIILILGGRDKGTSLEALARMVRNKVEKAVLLGEAAPRFEAALREFGFGNIANARSLEDAVAIAREAARPGRVVLFSPACASFDMFKSFEHRGEMFRKIVGSLEEVGP